MLSFFQKLTMQQVANTKYLFNHFEDSQHLRNLQVYTLSYHINKNAQKSKISFKEFYQKNPEYKELIRSEESDKVQILKGFKESQVVWDINDFDNESIVARMRIAEYRSKKIRSEQQKRALIKGGIITYLCCWVLSFFCQLYYYIEYDFWITTPEVSDYQIYRFS